MWWRRLKSLPVECIAIFVTLNTVDRVALIEWYIKAAIVPVKANHLLLFCTFQTWSGGHEVALWLNGLRVSDGWFLTNQRVEHITWCVIDIELDSRVLERFPDWTSSLIMFMCLFWKMFTFLCGSWTRCTSVAVRAQNSDERVANSYGLKLVRVY